jgi:hypothetical protein
MASVKDKKRNWHEYNQKLVNETLDLFVQRDILESFKNIDTLNDGKVGRPFQYANSVILMICAVREYFYLPYRQAEGFANLLGGMWGAKIPSYSQICRRQKTLSVPLDMSKLDDGPIEIIFDSTGLKVQNRGDWIRQKYHVRRGFVKLHITCDRIKHRITSVKVTDEHTHDTKEFEPLLGNAKERVSSVVRVYGDTAYDSRANFNLIGRELPSAEPVIKPRANASGRSRGSYLRGRTAKEFIKDPKAWKTNHGYGQRWQIETTISTFKRKFGEYVRSISSIAILNEVVTKCLTYNILSAYRSGA